MTRSIAVLTCGVLMAAALWTPSWAQLEPDVPPDFSGNDPHWIQDRVSQCWAANSHPLENESIAWSGMCEGGLVSGRGTLTWIRQGRITGHDEGTFKEGRLSGRGKTTSVDGTAYEGNFPGDGVLTLPSGQKVPARAVRDSSGWTIEEGIPTRSPASMARAIDAAEALIAKGIDEARAELKPDAPKLARNGELDRIARMRSDAMAKGIDPFAHEDSKGRPAATDMMRERVSQYGAFGENIMYEFHSQAEFNPTTFAKAAVDEWLKSPGHRANILSPDYDRSGIGVALNGGMAYATQVFMGPARTAPRPERKPTPGVW